jgi:hypothetical protein
MKLFKTTIFAVLALATAALTGCTDDDDYSIGSASPGAYFPNTNETSVRASSKETVYEVPVCRTSTDAPSTYTVVSSVAPSEPGITIPSTVSFSGDALETTLPITYTSDVELSKIYDIVLKLEGASDYGNDTQTLEFQVASPLLTKVWDGSVPAGQSEDGTQWPAVQGTCTGTCTYYYDALDWGDDPGLPIYKVYDEDNPNSYDIVIQHWGYDVPLTITVPDDRVRDEEGNVIVRLYPNGFGDDISGGSYGETYVKDYDYYYAEYGYSSSGITSTFNPETGVIELAIIYYCSAGIFTDGYDTIQLDGYPDYSVSAEYKGLYTNTSDEKFAVATFNTGANVASVKAALVATTDAQTAYDYVVNDGSGVQEVEPGTDVNALFPVSKSGTYLLTAVSYDAAGDAQGYDMQKVVIDFGSSEEEDDPNAWTELGEGAIAEGWGLARYVSQPTNYAFTVTIRQSKENPTLYSIVAPFSSESYALNKYGYNSCTKKRNIEFTLDNGYIEIMPQLSGIAFDDVMSGSEMVIFNYEGFIRQINEDAGYEPENQDILDVLVKNDIPTSSIDEDGVITIPVSPFSFASMDEINDYSWQTSAGEAVECPTYILMPETSASTRHKVAARALAHPKAVGLSKAITAKAIVAKRVAKDLHSKYSKTRVYKLQNGVRPTVKRIRRK